MSSRTLSGWHSKKRLRRVSEKIRSHIATIGSLKGHGVEIEDEW